MVPVSYEYLKAVLVKTKNREYLYQVDLVPILKKEIPPKKSLKRRRKTIPKER
jgi:hypothetical protein